MASYNIKKEMRLEFDKTLARNNPSKGLTLNGKVIPKREGIVQVKVERTRSTRSK